MAKGTTSHFGLRDPRFQSLVYEMIVPATISADSNQTLTTAQVMGGMILRSIGAARTDTLPTAAALVDAIQGCMIGTSMVFEIRNTSAGAYTETIAAGTGGTAATGSTLTTAQNARHAYRIVFTNVTAGSEAYTLYSNGTGAF